MKVSPLRFPAVAVSVALLFPACALHAQAPIDILKTCKNEVGARYLNIPMAYINVDRGSKAGNNTYRINWTAKPPGGAESAGFCVVDTSYNVLRFETTAGPKPGDGGGAGGISPEDAMRTCKNEAANRLRNVPMTYINVQRASNAGDGSYVINWWAQPPGSMRRSGFCNITQDGRVRDFQFDKASGNPPGGNFPGGGTQPPGRVEYAGLVRNRNSQRCLDVGSASRVAGGKIQQYNCEGRANQQWQFVAVGRGEYAIRNVNSGLCLDVILASQANGAAIQQYPWNSGANQRWRLNNAASGTQIINVNSGKCLDVSGQARGNAPLVQQDCRGGASQRWEIVTR